MLTLSKIQLIRQKLLNPVDANTFFNSNQEFLISNNLKNTDLSDIFDDLTFIVQFISIHRKKAIQYIDKISGIESFFSNFSNIEEFFLNNFLIYLFKDYLIYSLPNKREQIIQFYNKSIIFFEEEFVSFASKNIISFYESLDFGLYEDKKNRIKQLIFEIDQTLDTKTRSNSITLYTYIFINNIIASSYKNNQNKSSRNINEVYDFIEFIIRRLAKIGIKNYFKRRAFIKDNIKIFSKYKYKSFEFYIADFNKNIFKNKQALLKMDLFNYNDFRKHSELGYSKQNGNLKYLYLRKMTEVLSHVKNYLKKQINEQIPEKPIIKIPTKLSVPQIAVLFKLFNEAGYMDISSDFKNKSTALTTTFSSISKEDISPDGLNKFLKLGIDNLLEKNEKTFVEVDNIIKDMSKISDSYINRINE